MKKKSSPNDDLLRPSGSTFSDLVKGLYYISETDAEVLPFCGERAESVTSYEVVRQTGSDTGAKVEGINPEAFFGPLIRMQEWFNDSKKQQAVGFSKLYDELRDKLTDLHVFKIGEIRIDIYIVGIAADGRLAGVMTHSIET